jgi:ER membrane protein complex subunit 3
LKQTKESKPKTLPSLPQAISGSMTLHLDPDIRDWVVLPLFVLIVIAGILRHVVSQYLVGSKENTPLPAQMAHGMHRQCGRIRSVSGAHLTNAVARRQHAVELLREHADRLEEEAAKEKEGPGGASSAAQNDPMEALMSNPMAMMGGNMVFMVQNMVRVMLDAFN